MMLHQSQVITFIPTRHREQAREFYRDVLGLRLVREEPVVSIFDANGVMLRITDVEDFQPARYTILGWQVRSIRDAIQELEWKGVSFARFPGLDQDEQGVWCAPSGAKVAWFRDPDGNILSLTQFP